MKFFLYILFLASFLVACHKKEKVNPISVSSRDTVAIFQIYGQSTSEVLTCSLALYDSTNTILLKQWSRQINYLQPYQKGSPMNVIVALNGFPIQGNRFTMAIYSDSYHYVTKAGYYGITNFRLSEDLIYSSNPCPPVRGYIVNRYTDYLNANIDH